MLVNMHVSEHDMLFSDEPTLIVHLSNTLEMYPDEIAQNSERQ